MSEDENDYMRIDRDYKIPVSLSCILQLETSLTRLIDLIKINFPMVRSELDKLNPHIDKIINSDLEYEYVKARVGKGSRATTLRQIQALFPDRDIEQYIQERLPKKYDNEVSAYEYLQRYINQTISILNSSSNNTNEVWFENTDHYKLLDSYSIPYYHGLFNESMNPESLQTGFYIEQQSRGYGYTKRESSKPDILIVRLKEQIWVQRMKTETFLYVYVPIEDLWTKTIVIPKKALILEHSLIASYELPFFDLETIKKEFDLMMNNINYQTGGQK